MAEDAEIANFVDDMDEEYYDKDDDSEEVELDGYDIVIDDGWRLSVEVARGGGRGGECPCVAVEEVNVLSTE
ncbi:hypothetical protein Syun_012887 [Stephania yunnanensis]|uniref:Uncharacterized protein n=1 Tax=Stephania yunnanensis TaxID=152371 RepID=A0AAP0K0B2_9MAGN